MAIEFVYGGYQFIPRPLLNISKEFQKAGNGDIVGVTYPVSLEGTFVPTATGGGGLEDVDQEMDQLRVALETEGQLMLVICESGLIGEYVVISGYPRVNSISFPPSSNQWVQTTNYTVELEFDDIGTSENTGVFPPYISTASEQWSVEFVDDKSPFQWDLPDGSGKDGTPFRMRVTHSVSAQGKKAYDSDGLIKPAWEQARDYVVPLLGFNSEFIGMSGVLNLSSGDFTAYNHIRTNEVDQLGGSISVTETWLAINATGTGVAGNSTEDFNITVQSSIEDPITRISIEGQINGLETRNYGTDPGDFDLTEQKYTAASGYWDTVKQRLYGRSKLIAGSQPTRALNIIPVNTSVGHNVIDGVITYTYEYNDRPSNCISGALSESIVLNDNNPVDIFASLVVLGRSVGPVLQSIGTIGPAATRELSIEVVMQPATGCPHTNFNAWIAQRPDNQVGEIVSGVEANLTGTYSQVFKNTDNSSWDSKTGRYSRNVGWTYQDCS